MRGWGCAAACAVLLAWPAGSSAQDQAGETASCVETRIGQQARPGACIEQVLQACDRAPANTPAVAMLCYEQAREVWGQGLSARMAAIREGADDRIAAIAGIEVKYDLLAALMQCDRVEELALMGEAEASDIQRGKARCAAAATGLVYVRLLMQARDL